MIDLAERRATELRDQKAALANELANWRERTTCKRFEKHHSQVTAITTRLDGLLETIAIADGQAVTFQENERAFSRLLGAHRIWDYFRSKLSLRDVDWLRDDLICADELAWECYHPAREKAEAAGTIASIDLKEPPLVFFSGDATPFVQARDTIFAPAGVTPRDVIDLGSALLKLPIPVIGIPWFQLRHLPSAVVIGHEVGHAVERDFGLVSVVEQLICALELPAERQSAWLAWSHEIFADIYSVLCTGPAAVLALMDYLVGDVATIQQEQLPRPRTDRDPVARTSVCGPAPPASLEGKTWGTYPTRYLRMLVNFEALRQLGLSKPTRQALNELGLVGGDPELGLVGGDPEQVWHATYQFHAMPAFKDDVKRIVTALLDGPYPAFGCKYKRLHDVIAFTATDLPGVGARAYDINHGQTLPEGDPMRRLFASATLAYYVNPAAYAEHGGHQALLKHIREAIPGGERAAAGVLTDEERAKRDAANRQAGRDLLEFFTV